MSYNLYSQTYSWWKNHHVFFRILLLVFVSLMLLGILGFPIWIWAPLGADFDPVRGIASMLIHNFYLCGLAIILLIFIFDILPKFWEVFQKPFQQLCSNLQMSLILCFSQISLISQFFEFHKNPSGFSLETGLDFITGFFCLILLLELTRFLVCCFFFFLYNVNY